MTWRVYVKAAIHQLRLASTACNCHEPEGRIRNTMPYLLNAVVQQLDALLLLIPPKVSEEG